MAIAELIIRTARSEVAQKEAALPLLLCNDAARCFVRGQFRLMNGLKGLKRRRFLPLS